MICKLEPLTGSWFGNAIVHVTGEHAAARTLATSYKAQLDLGGELVVARQIRRAFDRIVYQALSVFAWEPALERYTMHVLDSSQTRTLAPASGSWRGDTLELERTTSKGRILCAYTIKDDMHWTLRVSTAADGDPTPTSVLECDFERQVQ